MQEYEVTLIRDNPDAPGGYDMQVVVMEAVDGQTAAKRAASLYNATAVDWEAREA